MVCVILHSVDWLKFKEWLEERFACVETTAERKVGRNATPDRLKGDTSEKHVR